MFLKHKSLETMTQKLSKGSLEVILSGGDYEKPVMQLLNSKRIRGCDSNQRFRLWVSDGKHSYSLAMLATEFNDKVISGELSDYSVVQINKFFTSLLNKGEKRVMFILDITILAPGTEVGKKLGNPQSWTEEYAAAGPNPCLKKPVPQSSYAHTTTLPKPSASTSLNTSLLGSQVTHPLASLSPYQNKWVIKARVMNKSAIRTLSNAKGEKVFSMDLCDDSGEIRATAFKDECDKFYDMIQIDKVYYISRCQLKTANKQFTSLKNDYEMTFTHDTVVAECMEDAFSLPTVKYDFLPISDIANKSSDSILDTIGVCKDVSDLQELTAKKKGKLLKKREVTLVDQSGAAITLTLWGTEAENFDGNTNPIIAVKGARLAEFNGNKSLSCLSSTMLRRNPDLPEAHRLNDWYDLGKASAEFVNMSIGRQWFTISESQEHIFSSDKTDYYFTLLGVPTLIYADNVVYKACPQENCNKKMINQENNMFLCKKCNREYSNFKYRLMFKANVSDQTGNEEITVFNNVAEVMLGQTAEEVARMLNCDKKRYAQLFDEVMFTTFLFKLRTTKDTLTIERRFKTTAISAQPVNYKEANARIIKNIKLLDSKFKKGIYLGKFYND